MIYLLAYLIVGCLFTLYFKSELFPRPEEGYPLATVSASILCGPLAIAGVIVIALNCFINSFIHRVFR